MTRDCRGLLIFEQTTFEAFLPCQFLQYQALGHWPLPQFFEHYYPEQWLFLHWGSRL